MTPPSQTLVLQSYRRHNVAPWIDRCMTSVRAWADAAGHPYEFVDDSLFDLLPGWFRDRCAKELLPQTDLARLLLMRERLRAGHPRVIWLDADIHVFAPHNMRMDNGHDYALCLENWMSKGDDGQVRMSTRINNAAMVMAQGNPVLDFLIHACEEIARNTAPGSITKLEFGPRLLSRLASVVPLHVVREVVMISPGVLLRVARADHQALDFIARAHQVPVAAANLCGSLIGTPVGGTHMTHEHVWSCMDQLEARPGAAGVRA